ncbi:MAG TPA: bifunctional DNA-formamidopyrimidine glycosylase/DNA-(apurinic or apyrimidinic site) lyase [Myxococcaceae bacterium]|nr:bifunctional DNA-formamidopyrimidine glycosylase/DNA-(apurinic or apyrimidinic site) lyase [Myxococcaceae bacterium]
MPELPEVEITRRNLERWLAGRRVVRADAGRTRTFRGASWSAFQGLRGRLVDASRKGKYLLLNFENDGLLAHLGMTGKFVRRRNGVREPYSRARLYLDNDEVIHFRDPRRFGRLEPVHKGGLWQLASIRQLGRDPLTEGLSGPQLKKALGSTKRAIKVALLDQSRVAGLGNIHASEALFRAGIHPARKPASLSAAEWTKLARAIRATIRFALDREKGEEIEYVEEPGTSNPFLIYDRRAEPCPRCKTAVRSMVQAGRTTYYCPSCQPRRRPR